jgi:hypothetical protein
MPGQWGAGVAEKVQGQNEAYTAKDIARQQSINDLNIALTEAITKNDADIYNAGRNEFVRTSKQLGDTLQTATTNFDSILRIKTNDLDRRERMGESSRLRSDQAAALKLRTDEDRELRRKDLAQKAYEKDPDVITIRKLLENPYGVIPENTTRESLNQRLEQIYRRKHQEFGVPLPPSENAGKPGSKENPIKLG